MSQDALHTSILSTLALAEAESCPALSQKEIGAYLHQNTPFRGEDNSFARAYADLVTQGLIRGDHGYYALTTHTRAFVLLHENTEAKKKIAKNKIPLFLLQIVPFLQGVAITGSVAFDNATPRSDVDVFCIAEKNRLWTVRALCLLCAALFFRRRDKTITGEKICFNYFLTPSTPAPIQNIAAANMFAHMIPLFGHAAFVRFFNTNTWIASALHYSIKPCLFSSPYILRGIQRMFSMLLAGSLGDRIEIMLKRWQIRRIEKKITPKSDTSHLILRDDAIVLHYPHIKNKEVLEKYEQLMRGIGSMPLH